MVGSARHVDDPCRGRFTLNHPRRDLLAWVVLIAQPDWCLWWFWSGFTLNNPRGESELKRLRWGMPMTLEQRLGHVLGHGEGCLPARRLGLRHDANRTVYHFAATALRNVSSNLFEVFTARQVCSFACSAAPIADGATVRRPAPGHAVAV